MTYPGVAWAYMLAGDEVDPDPPEAAARAAERKIATRYWNPEFHAGAFSLPTIVREALQPGAPPDPFNQSA
jgi:spermidine synthase